MKRVFMYFTFLAAVLFVTSCEFEEPKDFTPDESDAGGNLLIINNSQERLVLYKDEYVVKKIPASATDYVVHIDNPNETTVQLDLFLWEDVKDDINNPNPDDVWKSWLVPLSASDDIDKRATWHVSGADQYKEVATLNFSYYGGTDNFVDVYLDGRTGSKVMSLKPGDQYKKVGVDYGNHTLHYLYWFSDQNTSTAFEELGWIEKETVNGEEKSIWLILNAGRKEVITIIPHYGAATSKGMKYGNLTIRNSSDDPVSIEADGKLIEQICYLDNESKLNLSTIGRNDTYTFVMPIYGEDVTTQEYTLVAKSLPNGYEVESTTITITMDETVEWVVDGK